MRGREERRTMDEGAMEFTMDELREFLEGDLRDVRADPEFKEKLRRKLWEMVTDRVAHLGLRTRHHETDERVP